MSTSGPSGGHGTTNNNSSSSSNHISDDVAVRLNLIREFNENLLSGETLTSSSTSSSGTTSPTTGAVTSTYASTSSIPAGLLRTPSLLSGSNSAIAFSPIPSSSNSDDAEDDQTRLTQGGSTQPQQQPQSQNQQDNRSADDQNATIGRRNENNIFAILTFFVYMPQLLSSVIVLVQNMGKEQCDAYPLDKWAMGFSMYLAILLFSALIVPAPNSQEESYRLKRLRSILDSVGMVLLVVGAAWVTSADGCDVTAPHIYSLCVGLVVFNFLVAFMPLTFLIILFPFVCLCMPCILRLFPRIRGMNQRKGATPEQLAQLPVHKYKKRGGVDEESSLQGNGDNQVDECSICLTNFEEGDEIRILSCNMKHFFHKDCADSWFRVNPSCPVCRTALEFPNQNQQQDNRVNEQTGLNQV